MTEPRFLQIHFLAPYVASLLNRDDAGLAKRLPFGQHMRTRISSQCLKYHWRKVEDRHALKHIEGFQDSFRSRETVGQRVMAGMVAEPEVLEAVTDAILTAVYGEKGTEKKSRQTLLLGDVEVAYLRKEASRLIGEAGDDVKKAKQAVTEWSKDVKANLKAMRDNAALPGGLVGALFGRMVTSDPTANIDAPVHVAHAFTVHAEEAEADYFIAADDLARDEDTGADTIQETELTSGLFYGYVVVDVPGLMANVGQDARLAGEVLHNLLYLIAETSPGAKLGSTAPYSRASFMMVEAGDRQPRSLAEAFRVPSKPVLSDAVENLAGYLASLDALYSTGETRHVMSLADIDIAGADRGNLAELAGFVRGLPEHFMKDAA
ncbi:MAG: type I-E CRISPR-associated protein Cas7/Cse4/CasC [Rhizobiaceae bacterium]|nr:type I-E CRISPR-associated protein Cas7/Cse4/CasC [Rhizobiaceae bacterium]